MSQDFQAFECDSNNKWSVIIFTSTNELTVVPSNWIKNAEDSEESASCAWPVGDKSISKKIKKRSPPDPSWEIFQIRILKEFDTYEKGKEYEKRVENESTDCESDKTFGRGKRKTKRKYDADFIEEIPSSPKVPRREDIPSPPKFSRREKTPEVTRCEELYESPDADNNSPREDPLGVITTDYIVENGMLIEQNRVFTEDVSERPEYDTSTITMSSTSTKNSSSKECSIASMKCYSVVVELKEMLKEIKNCLLHFPHSSVNSKMTFETTPKAPFKKYHKLTKYEATLRENEDARNQLETMLYLLGGSSPKEHIKRGLKSLFTNRLAVRCSWTERNHNYPLKNLSVMSLLKVAVRKRWPDLTDVLFEDIIKTWFRQASLRYSRECAKTTPA